MSNSILIHAALIPPHSHKHASQDVTKLFDSPFGAFQDAFHFSPQPVAITGADNQTILLVNPACAELYGYAVEEMVGMPVQDVFAPEARAQVERDIQRANTERRDAEPGHPHRVYETVHARRDGTTFPVSLNIHQARDAGGGAAYRVIYVQDITEKRGLLTSLRETELERAYVMSGARCLLWHAQVKETGDPRKLDWNLTIPDMEAAQRFLPLDRLPGEDYPNAWYRNRDPQDRDVCDVLGTVAVRAGESYDQEFRCYCSDGSIRWLREDIRVETLEPGQTWRVVGVCTDITERKQAEKILLDKQASIEKLNDRLRLSMTETHHRVKNNLQMISALIDMRVMEAGETVSVEELRRLSAQIQSLAVVHDVLTGASREQNNAQRVSTRRMLSTLLPKLRQMSGEHELTYRLDDASLRTGQSTSLALITQELYANALKHGKERVDIQVKVEGARCTLSVSDSGPGFPPNFNAAQAANTGLELVLNLTRTDLQGEVAFDTLPTGGGRVSVSFPLPQ